MKKIPLGLILSFLSMIVSALRSILKLAEKIADLVDNGKIDDSFERPIWMLNVEAGLEYAGRALSCLDLAQNMASKDFQAQTETDGE